MDGDIVGPDDLSLTDDANGASGHTNQALSEPVPDLKTKIIGPPGEIAVSHAEAMTMTGPSDFDRSLIDFMTSNGPKQCGCKNTP